MTTCRGCREAADSCRCDEIAEDRLAADLDEDAATHYFSDRAADRYERHMMGDLR